MRHLFKNITMSIAAAAIGFTAVSASDTHDAIWQAVHENAHRKDAEQARDTARHPEATLRFFGVDASKTVVEINPGGQWYSRILGPLLKDKGHYIGLEHNPSSYADYKNYAENLGKFQDKMAGQKDIFGDNASAGWLLSTPQAVEAGSVDVVMVVRAMHNWKRRGFMEAGLAEAFAMLKSGGILGVVQHRADENDELHPEDTVQKGRWAQSAMIKAVTAAGFELVEASEINANPRDKKNYKKGVWTLSPSFALGDVDRAKFEAIG